MRPNPAAAFTLILLSLMFGAGVISASWGYALGRKALEGITQPDARPISSAQRSGGPPRREELQLLDESAILNDVKIRMDGRFQEPNDIALNQAPNPINDASSSSIDDSNGGNGAESQQPFPLLSEDQGVTLEVSSTSLQDDALQVAINLRNDGNTPVQFLYSFMQVTDDQGQALSISTKGLPSELPATGQTFSGSVIVPTALLDDAQELSLLLTDYPNQQLQLSVSGIPIE